jgi:hypothetical protein
MAVLGLKRTGTFPATSRHPVPISVHCRGFRMRARYVTTESMIGSSALCEVSFGSRTSGLVVPTDLLVGFCFSTFPAAEFASAAIPARRTCPWATREQLCSRSGGRIRTSQHLGRTPLARRTHQWRQSFTASSFSSEHDRTRRNPLRIQPCRSPSVHPLEF